MYFSEFETKLKNHNFTEEELRTLYYDFVDDDADIKLVEEIQGEIRRWSHFDTRIWKFNDRYFELYGDIGSTEYQDDGFYEDPIEIRPIKKVITQTITTYEPI